MARLALAACLVTLASGCSQPATPTLTPSVIDLGTVWSGETSERTFTLSNPGPRPVRVRRVVGSCSCQSLGIDSPDIPPGGSARIKVRLTVPDNPGPAAQTVDVEGEGLAEALTGTLLYECRPVVVPSTGNVYEVPGTWGARVRQDLRFDVKAEIHEVGARCRVGGVARVRHPVPASGPAQAGYRALQVSVEWDLHVPCGRYEQDVEIVSNDKVLKTLRVACTVSGGVECTPRSLYLGAVDLLPQSEFRLIVKDATGPAAIEAIDVASGCPLEVVQIDRSAGIVVLKSVPKAKSEGGPAKTEAYLHVKLAATDEPLLVPVRWFGCGKAR